MKVIVAVWLSCGFALFGFDLKPEDVRGKKDHNPVSVLQKRFFLKANRPEIGTMAGTFLNEAYTDTYTYGFRGSYFLSEWVGAEIQWFKTNVKDSDDRKALNQIILRDYDDPDKLVSPDPEVNPVYGGIDTAFVFAPFYGKVNLMDFSILYVDLYFTAGVSHVDTEQGRKTGISFGAGQRFYMMKSLSFRIDFRDRIYTETRSGQNTQKQAASMDFGLSYFFL